METAGCPVGGQVETAGRRHDVERIPDLELVGREFAERAARLHAHADLERPAARRRTNAVGAPQGLAVPPDLDRQVLARQERVRVAQVVGHLERNADGIVRFARFGYDLQLVKLLHGAGEPLPTGT